MRVAAVVALIANCAAAGNAQPPAPAAFYREAVDTYVKTGNAAAAVKPLLGWDRKALDTAVKDIIATGDAKLIEGAAILHLEIGVAIAGISTPSSQGYFDLGATLIDTLYPITPEARSVLTAVRVDEITRVRATWHGVAGSAFLSVNDIARARLYFNKAIRIAPRSPEIITLLGAADELDGAVLNPDDVDLVTARSRIARERGRLLTRALQQYDRALEIDPTYALAQLRLGRVYLLLKRPNDAEKWLAKGTAAAREASHLFLAAMFTGALHQERNDVAGARASFERALSIAPRSQNAVVALAHAELMSGRPDRAQALAREFTARPASDDAWWASKNGTLDHAGLQWLRRRVRG
jgi:tetratricopeptide (TPR) repeat protein